MKWFRVVCDTRSGHPNVHTLNEFSDHLRATLDDDLMFGSCIHPPQMPPQRAQIKAVRAVEKRMGVTFSSEYREFLHTYGAAIVMAREAVWPRPTNETVVAWEFAYGLSFFGTGGQTDEDIDIEVAHERLLRDSEGTLPFPLYPILETIVPDGELICLDNAGFAFEWNPVFPGRPDPLGQTYFECLAARVSELAERKREMVTKRSA